MSRPRRPRLVQVLASEAPFLICEDDANGTWWDITIRDAIEGDRPTFRYTPPRTSKHPPFTPHRLACAGAGECNEARGMVTLTEYRDGLPVFVSAWASNGSQVFCIRSTDPTRAKPVELVGIAERARHAIRAHRVLRALDRVAC